MAKTIKEVKDELEKQTGQPLEEVCIAAIWNQGHWRQMVWWMFWTAALTAAVAT